MSTYATIYEACLVLVETVTDLRRSPYPIDDDGLLVSDTVGPAGGMFTIAPLGIEYGGTIAGSADCRMAFVVRYAWAQTPDPATRLAEVLTRAEAIRGALLDESQTTLPECRFTPGDPAFSYPSADVVVVDQPFSIFTRRTT